MKKFRYAIFDMDGTLIDSMSAWRNLGKDYLKGKGIKAPENLNDIIISMSMAESANYFREEFGIKDSVRQITIDINQLIENKYKYEISIKPFAREYLLKLKEEGVAMCVATASPVKLAEIALRRLGILEYFSFVVSCDDACLGKNKPDVYYLALEKMNGNIKDTVIYEDADYALKTAKKAGFYTIGVYDESAEKSKEEMRLLCHEYIESFQSLL